jgi:hypothetical protein
MLQLRKQTAGPVLRWQAMAACAQYDVFSSCELYNPATNAWTTTGAMHDARWWHRAAVLPSGNVLVAGGIAPNPVPCFNYTLCSPFLTLNTSEIYSPATGTWTQAAQMPYACYLQSMVTLPTGLVLVTGGFGVDPDNPIYDDMINGTLLYNETADSWTATGPLALYDDENIVQQTAVVFSA